MVRIRIGFDIDDVLTPFLDVFMELAREMFGKPPAETPLFHYEVENDNYLLTPQEVSAIWDRIYTTPSFYETLPLIEGSEVLSRFTRKKEFLPCFITARHAPTVGRTIEAQTQFWLYQKLKVPFPTVIVGSNKGEVAKALNLNYFIDNKPECLLDVWETTNGCTKCYVFDRPHNRWFNDVSFERVGSLRELYTSVQADWKLFGAREPVGGLIAI